MSAGGPLWHSGLASDPSESSDPSEHPEAIHIGATARAGAYGDGLFESVLMLADRGWLLGRHLARLQRGLAALQLQPPTPERLHRVLSEACAAAASHRATVLKLQVGAAAQGRGYGRLQDPSCELSATLYPAAHLPQSRLPPARVHLCSLRLALQPALAGIKHTNRLEQVLASNEWAAAGADEGLMLDSAGLLIEGTHSNVILQLDGELVTPDLSGAGVAGVFREWLLEQSAVITRPVSLAELEQAQGLWLVNSVFGLRAVARMDLEGGTRLLDPARVATQDQQLEQLLHQSLTDELDRWDSGSVGGLV